MNNPQCEYPNCKEPAIDKSSYCILHDAMVNDI